MASLPARAWGTTLESLGDDYRQAPNFLTMRKKLEEQCVRRGKAKWLDLIKR